MRDFDPLATGDADIITAENGNSGQAGTALAINTDNLSCSLVPAASRGWGGARNRADRVSEMLTTEQCAKLIAAARFAETIGLPFNRHWIVHSQMAGIQPRHGIGFVGKLLRFASKAARRQGGELAALYVRENGEGKGEHVHILTHLPRGKSLLNLTRRWIVAAGGAYKRDVSFTRSIGGPLLSTDPASELYLLNADNVLAYLLKHGDQAAMEALGLPRWGQRGWIIGKRSGTTQNISEGAQRRFEAALAKGVA